MKKTDKIKEILEISKFRSPSGQDFDVYHGGIGWGVWCWVMVGMGILTKDIAYKTLNSYTLKQCKTNSEIDAINWNQSKKDKVWTADEDFHNQLHDQLLAEAMKNRKKGVLISKEQGDTVAHALENIQERGTLFMGAGEKVYGGQIIGESAREDDMVVNSSKGKKLTNVRSSSADDATVLTPHIRMSLEHCIAFINDDEYVEVTPQSVRLRKICLDENERKRFRVDG